MAANLDNTLLNPSDVALLLGINVRTLANWRCQGLYNLLFVKVGGRVMYRQSDVDAFIEQRVREHT